MKTKKHFRTPSNLKLLLVLTVIATSVFAFYSCSENKIANGTISEITAPPPLSDSVQSEMTDKEGEPEPFVVVEEMPMFPGGDAGLLMYIAENTEYPVVAKQKNIQGRVIIRFCVTAKGDINQVSVLKGVNPEIDNEAIRVVKTLPTFEPGKQGGKPVPVWYMVPITFTLK